MRRLSKCQVDVDGRAQREALHGLQIQAHVALKAVFERAVVVLLDIENRVAHVAEGRRIAVAPVALGLNDGRGPVGILEGRAEVHVARIGPAERGLGVDAELGRDGEIGVRADGEAVELVVDGQAVVLEQVAAEVVAHVLVGPRHGQVVVLVGGRAQHLVVPVGAAGVVGHRDVGRSVLEVVRRTGRRRPFSPGGRPA